MVALYKKNTETGEAKSMGQGELRDGIIALLRDWRRLQTVDPSSLRYAEASRRPKVGGELRDPSDSPPASPMAKPLRAGLRSLEDKLREFGIVGTKEEV